MKRLILPLSMALAFASAARADFNPVAITPGSYTFDIVVESNTVQALPFCINATTGNGVTEGDTSLYEQGFYARLGQPGGNSGIPIHNTTFIASNNPSITYLMPPTYATNDVLMIDSTFTSGSLTFTTPTSATNLVILCTGGGGGTVLGFTVTHSDSSTETGSFSMPDWFNGGGTVAWGANGRVQTNGGYENFNGSAQNNNPPYLYTGTNITVSGAQPITSISFTFSSGAHANIFAVSGKNVGASTWSPIPVGGFNVIATVPAAFPLTATMDQGTNTQNNGNLNTWFEQGYVRDNPTDATYGLPPSGSIFSSTNQPTHHYMMGNYSANNAILIDTNHQAANITLASPAPYSAFAFLTAGGNDGSPMQNLAILQHADGVSETNTFYGYDWFYNGAPGAIAWEANGRVDMYNRTINNLGNGGLPFIFETYFPLSDTTSPVTNIVVQYKSGSSLSSTTYILAISASAGGVAPVITSGPLPATQTWYAGQTATFTVQVTGTAPITNAWYVESNGVYYPLQNGTDANGSVISGATTTTLTISGLTAADATNYTYSATNALGGEFASTNATLVINPGTPVGPIIDSQIPTASFGVLTNHIDTTTFSVTIDASSAPPLFYQWYNGLTAIPNATNASYANVDTNAATFYCIITNFVGAATSSPVSITFFSAPAPSPYESAVLAYHPVGYWPLNETNGTIAFNYAGTNDGTYTGTYTLGQPGIPPTPGVGTNTSAGFDGSTAYVDIPVNNLNITGAMTAIIWIQTPSGGETDFGTALGHSDQSYRLSVVNGANDPRFADDGPDIVGSVSVGDANWHQLVGVYDGAQQHLYVDGQATGGAAASTPAGSSDDVWIGAAPDYAGARNFKGNLAQVAILTNALSAAQVTALFNSVGTPPSVTVTPANPSVYSGNSITLTANLAGGATTSLQWYYIDTSNNSNHIAGATNLTYTIVNASDSQSGYFYGVIAANAAGSSSASVQLTVSDSSTFVAGDISPLNGEAYVGAPVTYSVNVAGSLPIYYQWAVDGTNVNGATNASYTFPAACGVHQYQVAFSNAFNGGSLVSSSLATLQGDAYPTNVTFNTNGTGWQTQGSVGTIVNNVLTLTSGTDGQASSAFYDIGQYVGSFAASFTYVGDGSADGSAFILQDAAAGTAALGGGGGELGYFGISNSVALEFNLYQVVGIAPGTNGNTYGNGNGAIYEPTGPVNVGSGDPINFQLNFANGVLAVKLTDTSTLATFSTNYTFGPLTPLLGGSDLAYVGFSGADGGISSIQTISNFEFNSVVTPVGLTVSSVSAHSFVISWPTSDTGFVLQTNATLSPLTWGAGPAPTVVGGLNEVTVNTSSGHQSFYRLARVVSCP